MNVQESMRVQARASYIRQSPTKVRQVLNMVRGRPVTEAQGTLAMVNRRAAHPVRKVLNSALANADEVLALDPEDLYVAAAYADQGPTLKRFRPRARGRGAPIRKPTSHITIVLAEIEEPDEVEE